MVENVNLPAPLYDQLKAHAQAVTEARDALTQFRTSECTAYAPCEVGDIVTITGHAHQGKQMVVDNVVLVQLWGDDRWGWKVVGRVVKKDGTVGTYRGENRYNIDRNK